MTCRMGIGIFQPSRTPLDFQQLSRLNYSWCRAAEFARSDAREANQMTPLESRSCCGEFFGHGLIVFLRVERAVFAHGETDQKIENLPRRMTEFAVATDDCGGPSLQILANSVIGVPQQGCRFRLFDLVHMNFERQRVPVQKISPAPDAISSSLIRSEYEASESISRVADSREISPRARRVARVDTNTVTMHAAKRFARYFFPGCPASVAQDKLIGSQGN